MVLFSRFLGVRQPPDTETAEPAASVAASGGRTTAKERPPTPGELLLAPDDENDGNKTDTADDDDRQSTSSLPAATTSSSFSTPDFIADESQLAPVAPEPPDLRELNNSLDALAVVFPDVQIDVFREMLTSFDGESRLALVADALLKNRVTWVKGRWRVADKGGSEKPKTSSTSSSSTPPPLTSAAVLPTDRFRTPDYQKAAVALASREFVGLRRSTILAVLAEHNYAYLAARRALEQLSARSWRAALLSSLLFLRRNKPGGSNTDDADARHPLVAWKPAPAMASGGGPLVPTIKTTGNAELDRELYDALVAPLRARQRADQEKRDHAVAVDLNAAEAEAAEATYECTCCFATVPFEEVTVCDGHDDNHNDDDDHDDDHDDDPDSPPHVVCFRCVQHAMREAVFGQGWARTIDPHRGTLRCPAVGARECAGVVPADHLERALRAAPRGADVLRHLDQRLAEFSLLRSGLPLVRCPFCAYAEVDDVYMPPGHGGGLGGGTPVRVRVDGLYSLAVLLLLLGATPLVLLPVLVLLVVLTFGPTCRAIAGAVAGAVPAFVVVPAAVVGRGRRDARSRRPTTTTASSASASSPPPPPSCLRKELTAALARWRRRRRGPQFRCPHPACGRVSCLRCGQAWADVHVCHESALVALRTQVEQAMSLAIKRVCPRCHTSFVKTAGCNKLTCPCGYVMCYVCRANIGPDAAAAAPGGGGGNGRDDGRGPGYRHFCEHFRPHGDGRPCTQCRRCNLWESEDTEAVLAAARAAAERRWRATERRALTASERAYLETGLAGNSTGYQRRAARGAGARHNNYYYRYHHRHNGLMAAAAVVAAVVAICGRALRRLIGAALGWPEEPDTEPPNARKEARRRRDRAEGDGGDDDTEDDYDDDDDDEDGDSGPPRLPTLAEALDWLLENVLVA